MWQRAIIGASWTAAAAIAGMLVNAYGRRRRFVPAVASTVLVLSLAAAATASAGVRAYGTAADARAVFVIRAGTLRSIPTDAETTQKTTALAAGTMAIADHTFLGWMRLAFENGQTGWVRKEDVVSLWK